MHEISIHDLIRQASARRVNDVFASEVPVHRQLVYLIEDAFMSQIPDGWYTQMLREANRRLSRCALTGTYPAPPDGNAFYVENFG